MRTRDKADPARRDDQSARERSSGRSLSANGENTRIGSKKDGSSALDERNPAAQRGKGEVQSGIGCRQGEEMGGWNYYPPDAYSADSGPDGSERPGALVALVPARNNTDLGLCQDRWGNGNRDHRGSGAYRRLLRSSTT